MKTRRSAAGFRAAAPDSCRWFYQGMPSAFVRNSIKGVVRRQTATYAWLPMGLLLRPPHPGFMPPGRDGDEVFFKGWQGEAAV